MAAILEPRSSGRNVIGGTFPFDLDQDGQVGEVLAVPFVEWFQ